MWFWKSVLKMAEKTSEKYQKIGIDTSVLVNLIIKDIDLFKFKEKEFSINDAIYYAMKTKYEFKGVMLNKFGFDKKEKNKFWKRAKNGLGLKPIKIGKRNISQYLNKVREANALLIKQGYALKYPTAYIIDEDDIEIIANFLIWGITKIYTSDRAFYETCKVIGLKSELIQIPEYSQMMKRL